MTYKPQSQLEPTLIESSSKGVRQALWRLTGDSVSLPDRREPVLFIHGATVPTVMSPAYQIDGVSWFDELAHAGFDVWGLDFPGLGASDSYVEQEAARGEPPGTAASNAKDIELAAKYVLAATRVEKLHVVAISRGTIPTGYFAAKHSSMLRTLTYVSPIVVRSSADEVDQSDIARRLLGSAGRPTQPYYKMGIQRRLDLLVHDRPAGTDPEMAPYVLANWVKDYELIQRRVARTAGPVTSSGPAGGTDLSGGGDSEAAAVPGGFAADLHDVWNGMFYDASAIAVPMLGVRGDYDRNLTTATDMSTLFRKLTGAPQKRFVTIDRGTHSIQLERVRCQLFDQVRWFLTEFAV